MSQIDPPSDLPDRYYCYMDEEGNLHKVDIKTGDIVASSPRYEDGLIPGRQMHPNFIKGSGRHWTYSKIYCDLICDRICKGEVLDNICKLPGFPPRGIVSRWRAEIPEFNSAFIEARRMRAEGYHDNVALALDEMRNLSKDEVPAEKLYIDTNKWLAEKNDPDTYGNRVKHSGDKDQPLTITVDTGIRRESVPEGVSFVRDVENTIEGETSDESESD